MLHKFGVAEQDLPSQIPEMIQGLTLIMDGDAACYTSTYDAKKLETAVRRFHTNVLEKMYLTQAESARVHITPKGCLKNYRDWLIPVKPYQGNRVNKEKPMLLEPLRAMLESHFSDHDTIRVFGHMDKEADDGIMQDCYSIPNTVMYSEDKDLCIVPTVRFNHKTGNFDRILDRYGHISLDYSTSTTKVIGHGTKFFWAQLLMGDSADNVKGLKSYHGKLCGAVKAHEILSNCRTEADAANAVFDGYRSIDQNILPEAECLWLTRVAGDSARNYFKELELSEANQEFLNDCIMRRWYMTADEKAEWDEIFNKCNSTKEVQTRWEAWIKQFNV